VDWWVHPVAPTDLICPPTATCIRLVVLLLEAYADPIQVTRVSPAPLCLDNQTSKLYTLAYAPDLRWLTKPRHTKTGLDVCDRTITRCANLLRIAHHGDGNIRVGDGRRSAGIIDHIQDTSGPGRGEEDREQIMEA
jgi:hypothetical protein